MIPKIIWQTHEWEYNDLPQNLKRCTQTWKNLNPEWEYRYHSAIDRAITVRDFDKELYQYYMFADKVTQSDIWRYVIIYQNGGFYTDMDSFCIMPLEYSFEQYYDGKEIFCTPIFYDNQLASPNGKIFKLEQLHNSPFAAIKKSEILKKVIDGIIEKYRKYDILDLYNIIEERSLGWSRPPAKELWLGTTAFANVIFENRDAVCFDYKGDLHSGQLKAHFKSNFMVNYYGSEISYMDLCKKNGWKDFI